MWLSWLEHRPISQKVVGSIPGKGTFLVVGSVSSQGTYGRQTIDVSLSHQCFSLSLTLSLSLSLSPPTLPFLKSISMSLSEDYKKEKKKVNPVIHPDDGILFSDRKK